MNARQGAYFRKECLIETSHAGGLFVLFLRQGDKDTQGMFRPEAWIGIAERGKASDQQSGADNQNERKRDFGRCENGSQSIALLSGSARPACFVQPGASAAARCRESRKQAKDDSR
jgi:hypothetical protein